MDPEGILSKTLKYTPLLLMIGYPVCCRYDFSKSNLWYYDFLSMNGNVIWFVLAITIGILLLEWRRKDLEFPSLIAVVLLFSIAEVAVNYPLVWRDVFLHGSAVLGIIQKGHIANTWNEYPLAYPGFFLLWSMVTVVTGVDLFTSNLLLMLPVTLVLLITILILTHRKLKTGYANLAVLFAFLLMNFNENEFTFVHFNTRLLSFIFVLLCLFILVSERKPAKTLVFMVIFSSLVITHALSALVIVVFLAIYLLLFKAQRRRTDVSFFLLSAVVYTTWAAYVSYSLVTGGVQSLFIQLYILRSLEIASQWSPQARGTQPLFGILLGAYYKILLISLAAVSLYCMWKMKNERNVRFLAAYLLSGLLVFGVSFFSVLADVSIDRGIIFGSVSLAALPIILHTSLSKKYLSHPSMNKLFGLFIIILIIPQFVFVHQWPMARYLNVGSIDSTSRFVLDHRSGQSIVSLGDFPIYYSFYEPFFTDYQNLGFSGWHSLDSISTFLGTSTVHGLRIVDYRKIVDWSAILGHSASYEEALRQWHEGVYAKLDTRFNRIYANSFETIYS